MIGSTNSKISIGGLTFGDSVLAFNKTSDVLSADDKVLLRYNLPDTTKKQEFSISAASSTAGGQTYVQPVWFNNNLFCVFAGFNNSSGYIGSFSYQYNGSAWLKTALTGVHNINPSRGVRFRYISSGMLCIDGNSEYGNRFTIDSSGQTTTLFSDTAAGVIGKVGNVTWNSNYQTSSSSATKGIWANDTRVINETKTKGHYLDAVNKLLLYTQATTPKICEIGSDDASVTSTHTSSDIGTAYFVGCTGLSNGDYVFFADDSTKEQWNNTSQFNTSPTYTYGTVESSYSVFKIDSSYILQPIEADDTLYPYMHLGKSLWRFDDRNNCLVIGTTNDVYVLEFNKITHTWTLIASGMSLPDNNSGQYIYNASLSPDKRRLAVYAGDTNLYAQKLFIYDISTGHTWTIVDNLAQNYDSTLSFTGIATGDTEEEGGVLYDVINTVLPSTEEVSCSLTCNYVPALSIV